MTEGNHGAGTGSIIPTLTGLERVAAFCVAVLLAGLGFWAYISPISRTVAIDGCQPTDAQTCVVDIEENSETVVAALTALSGAAFLIGLLGRRFTSLKAGPVELSGRVNETTIKDLQQSLAKGELESVRSSADAEPASAWAELPLWVRSEIYRWVADNPVLDDPVDEAVEEAYKPSGQGNFAWNVRLKAEDGERVLRVSQGRGSAIARTT